MDVYKALDLFKEAPIFVVRSLSRFLIHAFSYLIITKSAMSPITEGKVIAAFAHTDVVLFGFFNGYGFWFTACAFVRSITKRATFGFSTTTDEVLLPLLQLYTLWFIVKNYSIITHNRLLFSHYIVRRPICQAPKR